ncbi:aldehyde dehydrogenase family protein, partial [Sinorhizobium medicae]|nr:aldehyde dehydrogenase family protein [Sinorhizobium medicae]MDX0500877.1 aldehyde dehydrogenase family protein [Sinorhizobium medicae]MDX0661261.1 aldehyde dehydrogenase family protein [Sinorhizobium medicae]MDX0840642.1 aldehyde dehydrogenase family protein [Sinorhizobium medicae]MDX0877228.1 aldehyde dehydrogenase family protein [Sinorhizobium medicae]
MSRVVHGSFSGRGVGNRQLNNRSVTLMPFKHNAARRHRIGSMKFKVTNWPSRSGILERHAILKKTADEILARKDE